eukprot:scaffold15695_cov160-Amphora_coffeaeformis.AAC.6
MKSAPQTTVTLTPMRRTTPTSAFSTPSRSFSSVHDDEDVTEDFQLQYPSPLQPHLEMEADEGWKASVEDGGEYTGEQDGKHSVRGGESRVTEDSPRSALDGIPFTTYASAEAPPTQGSAWSSGSPGMYDSSTLGFLSHMSTESSSPQRSIQSFTGLGSPVSTPPREQAHSSVAHPPLPPSYKRSPQPKRTLFPVERKEEPKTNENTIRGSARSPIDQLNEQLLSQAHHMQPRAQPMETSEVTSVASSHHKNTTLSASNLIDRNTSQDNSQEISDFMSPERSFADSAAATPTRSSPTLPDTNPSIATNRNRSPSPFLEQQDKRQSPHADHRSGQWQQLNQTQELRQASPSQSPPRDQHQHVRQSPRQAGLSDQPQRSDQAESPMHPLPCESPQPSPCQSPSLAQQTRQSTHGDRHSQRPIQPSPRQSPNPESQCQAPDESPQSRQPSPTMPSSASTPDRPGQNEPMPQTGQLQKHQKPPQAVSSLNSTPDRSHPSAQSAHSTPDRSHRSGGSDPTPQSKGHGPTSPSTRLTSPTPDRSQRSQQTMQSSPSSLAERFTKAQNFVKRVRGNALADTDGKIPPKPPTGPLAVPPAPPTVNSPSDCTPVVSNQQRKSYSASEEKKESEDWSSSAVKQMTKAVDHLKHLGESFIFDESPSRNSKGSATRDKSRGSDSHDRMSETQSDTSGPWWQKEETFHTDADAGAKKVAEQIVNESSQNSQRPSRSPSPPPTIHRTPHSPGLVKPIAMELTRTADLILQPDLDKYAAASIEDDEEIVKSCAAPVNVSISVGPASSGHATTDPSSTDSTTRAMTPMMRMRLPGAQESVLMGDNEFPSPATESRSDVKAEAESPPRQHVDFAVEESGKTPITPDQSRRSKSSRSSKGRSHGSNTRRSSRRRRRRPKEGLFGISPQCEGGIPSFLQNLIDRQCGQILDEDEVSESSYSSGDSGDDSDGETYGESTYKSEPTTPPRKAKSKDAVKEKAGFSTQDEKKLVDVEMNRMNEKERSKERGSSERGNAVKEEMDDPPRALEKGKDQQHHQKQQHEISPQKPKQPILDEERSVERVNRRKNDASNIRNKSFIREFISELSNDGIKLMQHRRSNKQAFSRPLEVTAYLRLATETGTNGFCEPCLQFLAHDGIPVVSVDLFDVRSLEKATALQLQAYPLAVPGNSLLIRTNPGDFVFEAKREDDAVRIVHGMRWLIARLSFNLIIGNVNVSCELLDVGRKAFKQRVGDSNRAKAMNDLANHLVDKSSVFPES